MISWKKALAALALAGALGLEASPAHAFLYIGLGWPSSSYSYYTPAYYYPASTYYYYPSYYYPAPAYYPAGSYYYYSSYGTAPVGTYTSSYYYYW